VGTKEARMNPLRLLLPALIPSWNFFDVIAASPRLDYALDDGGWRAFRPRPQRVSAAAMLGRLVWNPRWNESLFVVSCAERLLTAPTAHSEDEIFRRIAADLGAQPKGARLRFRIVLVDPSDGERETVFTAQPRSLADIPVR
jgi:hypothetical protein